MQPGEKLYPIFLLACFMVVATGFWLYNPFPLYFLNDDFIHIPLSKDGVLFQRKSFRPVCDLSVALDYFLWKKQAAGYHFINLLLHLADSVLVSVLAHRLFTKLTTGNAIFAGAVSGLLFFIYPFHSEAIYWILGRSASLGALFFLPAVIFYLSRNEKRFSFAYSLLFFSVGLLTYESIWIFPLIAISISWLDRKKGISLFKKETRYIITCCIVFLLFLIFRYAAIGEVTGNYEAAAFRNMEIKNLLLNAARLFIRSFIPPVESINYFYIISIMLFAIFIAVFAVIMKHKKNLLLFFFFLTCFFLSVIPYLSLGIDTHGSEGERFLYLPSIFVCVLITWLIFTEIINKAFRMIMLLIVFGYCLFYLFSSQKNYRIAGAVTRTAVKELQKLNGKKRLYIDSLPEECNGAVIFRLGFGEAVTWMKPAPPLNNILVLSSKQNMNKRFTSYKVIYNKPSDLLHNSRLYSDFNKATDAAFVFTDTALIVIK